MIPVLCRVHDDCVRACVASILELDAEEVPHFYHDQCDGRTLAARITDWLKPLKLAPFWAHIDGNLSFDEALLVAGTSNPDTHYILFCSVQSGDHAVICKGVKLAHNPAWLATAVTGPGSHGYWTVLVIART